MLAKVPQYQKSSEDEVEELAVRTDLLTSPMMYVLFRKGQRIQDENMFLLLSGKCLATEAGVEVMVQQGKDLSRTMRSFLIFRRVIRRKVGC